MKAVGGSGGTERGWEGWLSTGIKIKIVFQTRQNIVADKNDLVLWSYL
jgi:hypothetical protein